MQVPVWLRPLKKQLGRYKRQVTKRASLAAEESKVAATGSLVSLLGAPQDALCYVSNKIEFSPELLVRNYHIGLFPLGTQDGRVKWYNPPQRGIIPVEEFHVSKRLRSYLKRFEITFDRAFNDVIEACGTREETWIHPHIIAAYTQLHEMGIAHSVEAWQDGQLVGGGFGVAIGGCCTVESMFYEVNHSSKVAVVRWVRALEENGYTLFDTQYASSHWQQFGARDVPRDEFLNQLSHAIVQPVHFPTAVSEEQNEHAPKQESVPEAEETTPA